MRKGLGPTLLFASFPFVAGLLIGISLAYGRGADTGDYERAMAELRASVEAAVAAKDSVAELYGVEKVRADVAAAEANESALAALVYMNRWRDRPVPSPVDTAAILASFPGLVAAADEAIDSCERALDDCAEAIAAKDVAIGAADSALAATNEALERQTERAAYLDAYQETLADRIRGMKRWRPVRDILFAGLGGGVMYAACRVAP